MEINGQKGDDLSRVLRRVNISGSVGFSERAKRCKQCKLNGTKEGREVQGKKRKGRRIGLQALGWATRECGRLMRGIFFLFGAVNSLISLSERHFRIQDATRCFRSANQIHWKSHFNFAQLTESVAIEIDSLFRASFGNRVNFVSTGDLHPRVWHCLCITASIHLILAAAPSQPCPTSFEGLFSPAIPFVPFNAPELSLPSSCNPSPLPPAGIMQHIKLKSPTMLSTKGTCLILSVVSRVRWIILNCLWGLC